MRTKVVVVSVVLLFVTDVTGIIGFIEPYASGPYKLYSVAQVADQQRADPASWVNRTVYMYGHVQPSAFPGGPGGRYVAAYDVYASYRGISALKQPGMGSYPRPFVTTLPFIGSWFADRLFPVGPHDQIFELRLRHPLRNQRFPLSNDAIGTGRPVHVS